jgi:hypothetical protein
MYPNLGPLDLTCLQEGGQDIHGLLLLSKSPERGHPLGRGGMNTMSAGLREVGY